MVGFGVGVGNYVRFGVGDRVGVGFGVVIGSVSGSR